MKRQISNQFTFILSIIAFVFLLPDSSIAGEKQLFRGDQKSLQISAIAIDPVNTNTLYIGTQQGVFRSKNGGSNWIPICKDLKSTDVFCLAIDPVNTRTLYAGTRRGIFKSVDGGDNWILMKSCLREVAVLAIAIDPADTNTLYAIGNDAAWVVGMFKNHKNEIRYESKFRDYAFKSTNGGKKWSSINVGFEKYNLELESLAVDPIEPNTLYAGTRSGIYKSVDRGANWPEHKCKLGELNISTIVIDPRNNKTIYVGTMVGVFKSTDGGTNWTYFSKGLNKIDVLTLAIEPLTTQRRFTPAHSMALIRA